MHAGRAGLIRHISLDFWHTLAEPNPAYAEHRNRVLGRYYGVPSGQARQAYKGLKNVWEDRAVSTGTVPGLLELREQLGAQLARDIPQEYFWNMLEELYQLFLAYPPHLDEPVLELLPELVRRGYTLSVGSNTNFIIRGKVIRRLLPESVFSFQVYSDELGVCKPSGAFYGRVLMSATRCNSKVSYPAHVLHVGDNPQCDAAGAARLGIQTGTCSAQNPVYHILSQLEKCHELVSC